MTGFPEDREGDSSKFHHGGVWRFPSLPVNLRISCVMAWATSSSDSVSMYSDSCPAIQPHKTWPYLQVKEQTSHQNHAASHEKIKNAGGGHRRCFDLSVGFRTVKPNSFFIQDFCTSETWSTMASCFTRHNMHLPGLLYFIFGHKCQAEIQTIRHYCSVSTVCVFTPTVYLTSSSHSR